VSAFRGDTAIRLYVTLTDGGVPYYINDGCSAILCGTKADGTKLFNRCVIENNAVIRYDFTEQTTSCIGVANCEITLYDEDGDVITAPKFVIVVDDREASYESIVESHSERDALDALMVSATTELERVKAEKARVEAETERQLSEAERIKAEEARSQIMAKGVGDSSVVLNDLEKNDAGLRGYVIQSISGNTIYLDSVEGLAVGDVVSYSTYDYAQSGWRPGIDNGIISSVGANSITLTTSVSGFTMSCPTHDSRLAFKLSVRSKPWLGTADVSKRAMSIGRYTMATGDTSFTSGRETKAKGDYSSASGRLTEATGEASMADGYRTKATAHKASAKGESTLASGESSSAEGIRSAAIGLGSHAEGIDTKANGEASHTEGRNTTSHGSNTHTEGKKTVAIGDNAHAEGMSGKTLAEKGLSTSSSATAIEAAWDADFPGKYNNDAFGVAYGSNSHVEGRNTLALKAGHAEGCETKATKDGSHSEGVKTKAMGTGSHAEGALTVASGDNSHAEGNNTQAKGSASSAGGSNTVAEAAYSDAYGLGTIAKKNAQSVRGMYNADDSEAMFIVGAGSSSSRKNAMSAGKDSSGNMFIKLGNTKVTEGTANRILELIPKVEKLSSSFIFETVSTIAARQIVPDNAMPYARLVSIGGNTKSCRNLLRFTPNTVLGSVDNGGTITTYSVDENGYLVIDSAGLHNGVSSDIEVDFDLFARKPTTVTVSARYISGTATDDGYFKQLSVGEINVPMPTADNPITTESGTAKSEYFSNRIFAIGCFTNYKIALQIEEGETATDFNPYFEGLKSAKVKAVKSYGKNLYDGPADIALNGEEDVRVLCTPNVEGMTRFSFKQDITSGNQAGIFKATFTDGEERLIGRGTTDTNLTFTKKIKSISLNNYAKCVGRVYDIQLERGSNATDYSPYFCDTYIVPSAVQALDGYGASDTYIDFFAKTFVNGETSTDISADVPVAPFLQVESGGYVVAENDDGIGAPLSITYQCTLS
jgi:hypothetical protein